MIRVSCIVMFVSHHQWFRRHLLVKLVIPEPHCESHCEFFVRTIDTNISIILYLYILFDNTKSEKKTIV